MTAKDGTVSWFSYISLSLCTLFVVGSPTVHRCRLILLCNSTQRLPVICPKCPLRTDVSADRFLTTKKWGAQHLACFDFFLFFWVGSRYFFILHESIKDSL